MGRYLLIVILLLSGSLLFSQGGAISFTTAPATATPKPGAKATMAPYGSDVLKPTVGLGAGMLSFFGDLKPKSFFQNPSVSRIAFDLTLSQKLNSFLQFNFNAMFGKLGVTEDIVDRNANFESQIRLFGVNLQYNFDQLLPKKRVAEPIITLGVEGFDFLSKTDLYNQNGSKYYYWTDGSIKNLSETNANASKAVNLVRDYKYETDIRELNQDGFGKYAERSFAIPVGAGVVIHLGDRVDLKLHSTMHFAFTDYIDGITNKSLGARKGNSANDKFMLTGFSLHWDLLGPMVPVDTLPPDWFNNVDWLAIETGDTDGDGVRDTVDICPDTPKGASVNEKGCPTDGDGDQVPDFADKELKSKPHAVVDSAGVTIPDSIIKLHYEQFFDTTNRFAEVITKFHGQYDLSGRGGPAIAHSYNAADGSFVPAEYQVLLGVYRSGLPAATMAKFLSIRDIETTTLPDSSIAYTVGHYSKFGEAQSRKKMSIKDGINDAKIVYKKDGQFVEATSDLIGNATTKVITRDVVKGGTNGLIPKHVPDGVNKEDSLLVANTKGVVFRIQLGAYKRRLSKTVFTGINDLVEIRTEDGLYKYMTGNYRNFADAAKAKVDLSIKGYDRAFITSYNDGKRVTLTSSGATPISKKGLKENVNEPEKPVSAVSQKNVIYKVQIGVFKNEPPPDKKAKFKSLKDGVHEETTSTGLIRYTVGSTNKYDEALRLKKKMIGLGLDDAFIIVFFNGQYITIQEALELSK